MVAHVISMKELGRSNRRAFCMLSLQFKIVPDAFRHAAEVSHLTRNLVLHGIAHDGTDLPNMASIWAL